MNRLVKALIVLAVGVLIWMIPPMGGITPQGWHLLAIFVATILGFILQPLPIGGVAFIAITLAILTKTLKLDQALGGFSNSTIWLIVSAFLFAKGVIKSGLGRRIAFVLIRSFGTSSLKLAYTIALTELVIAPATPSNTARGGGIVFPIVKSLSLAFDSEPGPTARRMGSYMMLMGHTANISSAIIFMTASAVNPLVVSLGSKVLGVEVTWWMWFAAASVPGFISLFFLPYFIYKIYPPEIKHTPQAHAIAQRELDEMGAATRDEKSVAVIFITCLILWATSSFTGLAATTVAMVGVSAMVVSQALSWQDILEEKPAWDVLIWMGAVVGMAGLLADFKVVEVFANTVKNAIGDLDWRIAFFFIAIVYCYCQYFFASGTARVTALFSAFATVLVALGAPPLYTVLMFGMLGGVGCTLTHYGSAVTPIYFNAGYVPQGTWWSIGFVISVINFILAFGLGTLWLNFLGYV